MPTFSPSLVARIMAELGPIDVLTNDFHFSLAIWKHRTDDVHGATAEATKKIQEKVLDAKITKAYQHPDQHSENDRLVLFSKPIPVRLKTRHAAKVK